jgi:hypothetical protein
MKQQIPRCARDDIKRVDAATDAEGFLDFETRMRFAHADRSIASLRSE